MLRTRIFALLGVVCCMLGSAAGAAAVEVDCDGAYCFSAEDFGPQELAGICITALPESRTGTVKLGARVLRPGDILSAEQVAQMTFSPLRTETDQTASVSYLPVFSDSVGPESTMTISIRGKEDKAPVAEDFAAETYKNLPLDGTLKVKDPEEQAMTFTVTRQPRRGTVTVNADGSFTYTPKKNKVGVDSFTYTAADPAGNVSREATVTITILKPTDAAQYSDTLGKSCRFAAEWMKNTGIFVGENLGGSACFQPEREVTRGEFVAMLVKSLEIPTDPEYTTTHYTDAVPEWLRPYLAAAVRSGLTAGLPDQETFGADVPITGGEAAVMLQNALDLSAGDAAVMASDGAADWAAQALEALNANGFSLSGEETLDRGSTALALYQASLLAEEAPGMAVLRMQ